MRAQLKTVDLDLELCKETAETRSGLKYDRQSRPSDVGIGIVFGRGW